MNAIQLLHGDCLELMKGIPNNSVDLVLTDPPYNIGKAKWDKIPNYIEWCGKWFKECERVLKDNGSFYFWHNDMVQIAQLMEWLRVNSSFVFKQMIVWNKRFEKARNKGFLDGFIVVDGLRNYQQMAEYCLFYTFQDETGLEQILPACFTPYLDYMTNEKNTAGMNVKSVNVLTGHVSIASHWFWQEPQKRQPQPRFIGESDYRKLQSTGFWQRPYESLRQEYESLRYTFNNQKTNHSIWEYEIASKQGHITPKPIEPLENIIKTSSNAGDTVLDLFMGSGSTGVACANTNRNFIGIELDDEYYAIAKARIDAALTEPVQLSMNV